MHHWYWWGPKVLKNLVGNPKDKEQITPTLCWVSSTLSEVRWKPQTYRALPLFLLNSMIHLLKKPSYLLLRNFLQRHLTTFFKKIHDLTTKNQMLGHFLIILNHPFQIVMKFRCIFSFQNTIK